MAWRKFTAEIKIVKEFRKLWAHRRLKTLAIRGFQQNTVISQFHRLVFKQMKERREMEHKREMLNLMIDVHNIGKI